MECNKEGSKRDERQDRMVSGGPKDGGKRAGETLRDEAKRARILQCLGNLNALHKVQGALLGQMEREIE